MKLKKVLASILAVAMVLSTMSFTAFASGDTTADNAVASIGDQYYSTVALAMADAKANDTIVIHEDVTDLVSPAVAPLKFEAAKDGIQVTGRAYLPKVDLVGSITYDGFEFSNTDWAVQQWDGQEKLNNVELVYKNCDFAEKGICISWHQDKPDWNLDKVTLDTCTAADAKEVFSFQYVDAVEIVNCDFSNATDRIINVSAASGDVTVENCNFGEGSIQLSQNVGDEERNLTVTDSTFTGEKAIVIHENLTNAETVLAEIVITDNTVDESTEIVYFKDEEVAAVDYLAASEIVFSENVTSDNVEVTEISDGCEVANGSAVAVTVAAITKDGVTTNYTSLHDAVTAAQSGDVVEVLKDETYSVWNSVWNKENITINGNNHTLTVNSVDSNINGGGLFIKATDLTINDLTVVLPDNQTDGEMPRLATMYSGELNNVTVTGGTYVVSVLGGNGEVVINDCDFSGIDGWAVETEAQGNTSLTIQDSTFDEKAVIIRGDNTTFTGNTITATEKVEGVNVLGDTTITGNNFGASTLGIDQGITVVIENNIINSVEFPNWYAVENEDYSNLTVNENTLSDEAAAAFTAALEEEVVSVDYVATNGDKFYYSIEAAIADAQENDTITILAGEYNAFTVPASKTGLTFIGETDADGNNLVTIKTMEQATDVSNAGIWTPTNPVVGVYAPVDGVTFENINFTAGTYTTNWMASSIGVHNEAFGKANNLVVRNCNFTGSGVGSAIWMWSGSVTVENCTITGYEDGVVSYNLNTGDAVIIDDSVIDVSNRAVQVANETLSALENGLAGTVTITDSEITGNLALEAYNSAVTDFAVSISDSTLIDATITATNAANVTMTNNLLLSSVINTKSTGTFNGVSAAENYDDAVEAVAENNEIIPTALNISFEEVEAGLYNIVLDGEDDIYEFVGAELTFANTSATVAGEAMNYEILGISGTTNAEKSIEKADTYALRLVDGAERMSGRDLVIGQVKFYGQGDINFTVAEGKVVTTEYGTNLGQYYTLDADDTTADTLTVVGIVNGEVSEVTRTVVVNLAYNHALDGTHWSDNQITVTLKDGFGNVYDAEDLTNGVATINNVKLGRLTVTLEAPGFRKYVYNTTLEAGADADDALVLNFWNNVKRNEEINGVVVEPLAEIETGKGFMAHNFLVGDIVMDYTVDEYDLAAVTSYYGTYEIAEADAEKYIKYDLNRDGNIDIIDVHYVLHTLGN